MTDSGQPQPTRPRWQPLRAGLVDLFYYDYEEFRFRDGRLLLRGNNGTGKSKVMALTLPFLLDGVLSPARLEPDGDPSKRMEWNLLLGGRYAERQGYAWLEFGRLTDESNEFFSIGCGLRAVSGRQVRKWFFTTDQRVGSDFFLVESGRSLGRDRLAEVIGERGRVHEVAGDYRRAVDERLFQLGEERYGALIGLLLQLRQPQLSKRPEPGSLSRALTEALQPLDQAVLSDVADAFRNLEAERDELTALQEAGVAVDEFLLHYRYYSRIAARRRARDLRQAHSRYEETRSQLGHDRAQLVEAHAAREAVDAERSGVEERLETARQEEMTLRDSPAMRSAEVLRMAEDEARKRRQVADRLALWVSETEAQSNRFAAQRDRQRGATLRVAEEVTAHLAALAEMAESAGMGARHRELVAELALPDGDRCTPEEAGRQLGGLYRKRQEALRHVQQLNGFVTQAGLHESQARGIWQASKDEGDRLEQALADAQDRVREASDKLIGEVGAYLARLETLRVDDREALLAELRDWSESLAGENPVEVALGGERDRQQRSLAERRERLRFQYDEADERLTGLVSEHGRLESGEQSLPPTPHTRSDGDRATRPGAPLWQLVDFRGHTEPSSHAAIEAALEAAGLLDAWVMPSGELLHPDTWDTVLRPGRPVSGPTLSDVLEPASVRRDGLAERVGRSVVERILDSVGWGESDASAWIDAGGQWRLGPARGSWQKSEPCYLGHAAREAARRRRLAELAIEIGQLRDQCVALEKKLAGIGESLQRVDQEWCTRPSDRTLRDAHADEALRAEARREQQGRIDGAWRGLDVARTRLHDAERKRDEAAADLAMPANEADLNAIEAALSDYHTDARGLPILLRGYRAARQRVAEIEVELEAASKALGERRDEHEGAEREARNTEVRRDTLRETLGVEVDQLQRRLADVDQLKSRLAGERKHLDTRHTQLTETAAGLQAAVANGETRVEEQDGTRRVAIDRLQAFTAEGLLRVAAQALTPPSGDAAWAADPAVRLARAIEQALVEVEDDEAAWHRNQKGLHQHFTTLAAALARHGHDASAEQSDDLLLVRIVFQSRHCDPDELAESLRAEILERRALLDNKERELLENYLIDEVAKHLQEMIANAERQVSRMNAEIESRPMSTGMKLRIQWRPLDDGETVDGFSAPSGLREARDRLLRQVAVAWSPRDRQAVGEFLQQRIQDARDSEEAGSLLELLERVLDYRRWHRFEIERWQDGRWRPAYGPASGGERALVITIPLFAAAASHYGSAHDAAPRLVMLDEVFAGIDDDARAKCMGLLARFDLDVMMTSEREWGCYPEVPGLAIAQLVRREGVDAVFVSRWAWDGRRREREETAPMRMEAPEPVAENGSNTESLF